MKVSILMGSDSDLETVQGAIDILQQFGVTHDVRVLSAHRTPKALRSYLDKCPSQVFIAAAGGAAHLAGVIAAEVTKPVIALPVQGKSLNGLDSLLSMVQMPPGVPVACVGVGAGKNAGLLAVQILAVGDASLAQALDKFKVSQAEEVSKKDASLQQKLKK
ncbi:MAG TPA: 5-(carboxyamino)imidazole ribonucleotide mutase [Planctomycetota bacterium]|nr:5-(carboxyamino)imidazole ribonucleotide mutase [Planctomycetota bacterium]